MVAKIIFIYLSFIRVWFWDIFFHNLQNKTKENLSDEKLSASYGISSYSPYGVIQNKDILNSTTKPPFSSLYRTDTPNASLDHEPFPGSVSHSSAVAAAASLFGHQSVSASVAAGYSFPSLMAAVASSGTGNGDISTPGSGIPTNSTSFQQASPITPVPFRLGEFPFPGGLAAFRKSIILIHYTI